MRVAPVNLTAAANAPLRYRRHKTQKASPVSPWCLGGGVSTHLSYYLACAYLA
jgi:hypothetical protein